MLCRHRIGSKEGVEHSRHREEHLQGENCDEGLGYGEEEETGYRRRLGHRQ